MNKINNEDIELLNSYWHKETSSLNNQIDFYFKEAQDNAYQLGLKRGLNDMKVLAKRLRKANVDNDQKEWLALHDAIYKLAN